MKSQKKFTRLFLIFFQENHNEDGSHRSNKTTSNSNSNNKLNVSNYYESLRSNVMSLLGCSQPVQTGPGSGSMIPSSSNLFMSPPEQEQQQNFDSYLSKLQTMCSPNNHHLMMDESHGSSGVLDKQTPGGALSTTPMVYDSVKSSFYNLSCPLSSRT